MPLLMTPKRRIATRTLLASLALAIAATAAIRALGQRAGRLRQRGQFHARRAAMFRKSIITKECAARDCEAYGGERMLQVAHDYRLTVRLCMKLADYHARLVPKYEHAASQPWLPLEPDPPEPGP
jgi:hypothetical protein